MIGDPKSSVIKVVLIALGILIGTSSVVAQSLRCADRSKLVARLDQHYEKLAGAGISFDGAMLEFWGAADGRWTIMVTQPNGRSCIASHGKNWFGYPLISSEGVKFRQCPLTHQGRSSHIYCEI